MQEERNVYSLELQCVIGLTNWANRTNRNFGIYQSKIEDHIIRNNGFYSATSTKTIESSSLYNIVIKNSAATPWILMHKNDCRIIYILHN